VEGEPDLWASGLAPIHLKLYLLIIHMGPGLVSQMKPVFN